MPYSNQQWNSSVALALVEQKCQPECQTVPLECRSRLECALVSHIKPVLQALLVADQVYKDASSGKFVVCGIFSNIHVVRAENIPVVHNTPGPPGQGESGKKPRVNVSEGSVLHGGMASGSPFCFVSMVDVEGTQHFAVRYVRLDDDKVIFNGDLELRSSDRLIAVQGKLPLPPLPSEVGVYALELLWNGVEPLGSCRIVVSEELPKDKTDVT